jgi:beta-lactam-binding protein with PASTA domain
VPLAPREIDPDIPEQLELICMKAMAPDLERRYPSAEAMIADLEAFRKNPGVNLDFELSDLRPEESDEPTMLLRTTGNHRVQSPERDRRARYEEERRPKRRKAAAGRIALLSAGTLAALAVVFFLFRGYFCLLLTPSSTGDTYIVPDVTNLTVEEARQLDVVADGTFKIVERGSEPSDVAEGLIIRQDPEDEKQVKGELPITIEVWTSSGEDVGTMRDVTGKTYAEAKVELDDLIKQYDLKFELKEEASEEVEENKIISTDPAAGETLRQGDTIELVISKGMPLVPLVNFVGSDLDWALNQLSTLGLERGEITYEPSDLPEGQIISIDPADSEVPKGTKINFVVSQGRAAARTARRAPIYSMWPCPPPPAPPGCRSLSTASSNTTSKSITPIGAAPSSWRLPAPAPPTPRSISTASIRAPTRCPSAPMAEGRVIKALSGFYYVDTGSEVLTCRARGKFRKEGVSPLVGDRVTVRELGGGEGFLETIQPRRSAFARPAVANVDQLVGIASGAIPRTDPFLIDRVAAIAALKDCGVVVVLNKCDLDSADDLYRIYAASASPRSASAPRPGRDWRNWCL